MGKCIPFDAFDDEFVVMHVPAFEFDDGVVLGGEAIPRIKLG